MSFFIKFSTDKFPDILGLSALMAGENIIHDLSLEELVGFGGGAVNAAIGGALLSAGLSSMTNTFLIADDTILSYDQYVSPTYDLEITRAELITASTDLVAGTALLQKIAAALPSLYDEYVYGPIYFRGTGSLASFSPAAPAGDTITVLTDELGNLLLTPEGFSMSYTPEVIEPPVNVGEATPYLFDDGNGGWFYGMSDSDGNFYAGGSITGLTVPSVGTPISVANVGKYLPTTESIDDMNGGFADGGYFNPLGYSALDNVVLYSEQLNDGGWIIHKWDITNEVWSLADFSNCYEFEYLYEAWKVVDTSTDRVVFIRRGRKSNDDDPETSGYVLTEYSNGVMTDLFPPVLVEGRDGPGLEWAVYEPSGNEIYVYERQDSTSYAMKMWNGSVWTTLLTATTGETYCATMIGDYLYFMSDSEDYEGVSVLGGNTSFAFPPSTFMAFNLATGALSPLGVFTYADEPGYADHMKVINGKLYVAGAITDIYYNDETILTATLAIYDPALDTWSGLAVDAIDDPYSEAYSIDVSADGTEIYVAGYFPMLNGEVQEVDGQEVEEYIIKVTI